MGTSRTVILRLPSTIASSALRLLKLASLVATLLQSPGAFALAPELRMSQLYHTSWTTQDGAPTGIESLAQTSDGYVWLAASAGLFRFDGIRFERIDSIGGQRLPSNNIMRLFATRSNGLWIGYRFGGASFMNAGTVTNYSEGEGLAAASVTNFALDHSGVVWATTTRGLKRFNGSLWEDVRERLNLPSEYVKSLRVAGDGTLWIVIGHAVMFLRPGQPAFVATQIETSEAETDFVEAPDGTLWLTDANLGARVVYTPSGASPARQGWIALRDTRHEALWGKLIDRDGTLWMTSAAGIHRLKAVARLLDPDFAGASLSDVYSNVDGLSASYANAFLEDREGNVWVGTAGGVDRFRESRLIPVELPRAANGFAIAAGDSGALLVGIDLDDGVFEVTGTSTAQVVRGPQYITCAYRADDGAVWFGGRGIVWRSGRPSDKSAGGARWVPIAMPVDRANANYHPVQALAQDRAGRLWVSVVRGGSFRLDGDKWTRVSDASLALTAGADGRVWLGYPGSRIQIIDPDQDTVREFTAENGLELGNVLSIHVRTLDAWVGGELGLARFDGRRFHPVTLRGGRLLSNVSGIVVTAAGDLWLSTSEGAIRIVADEVRELSADPRYTLRYDLFDFLDGMPGTPNAIRPLPSIAAGTDGRLWFATTNGVVWIDPNHVRRNTLAPNVEVQSIIADGRPYEPSPELKLPVSIRTLQVTYTALSLSIPERVRFRYRLRAGEPWQDAGPRRTAYFTDLDPGNYTFQVTAANNDGVWNETGAALDFTVVPAFHQTAGFRFLAAAAVLMALVAVYRLRIRQIAKRMGERLEERIVERERIARELHDTLLQGFQGLMLRFQAVANRIPQQEPIRQLMESALERADQVLIDGRNRVRDLRSVDATGSDLVEALTQIGRELTEEAPQIDLRIVVQGTARKLHPIVRDEAYWIGREAILNAFHHGQAKTVEVEVHYEGREMRLHVRDDGHGIPAEVLKAGGRQGRFGLTGMRERARKIRGQLEIWSGSSAGTEVELRVPGKMAYRKVPRRASWLHRFIGA